MTQILDKITADKKLRRMALEVAERNFGKPSLTLIGIRENGIFIATKIAEYLKESFPGEISVLSLSLDKKNPATVTFSETVNWNQANILLIDDVANSGRTMLYALKPLLEFYPAQIQTLALVERTYKQFPIAMDYVGLSVATTQAQHIVVEVVNGEVVSAGMQ
ncbi:MAG: uracil phosphoribosyltransferase [Ferruginibacter sp.]|nr:uracil phosphoribosyltransferase [Ferruginibacter sp.]